jgi:hypothetical protein
VRCLRRPRALTRRGRRCTCIAHESTLSGSPHGASKRVWHQGRRARITPASSSSSSSSDSSSGSGSSSSSSISSTTAAGVGSRSAAASASTCGLSANTMGFACAPGLPAGSSSSCCVGSSVAAIILTGRGAGGFLGATAFLLVPSSFLRFPAAVEAEGPAACECAAPAALAAAVAGDSAPEHHPASSFASPRKLIASPRKLLASPSELIASPRKLTRLLQSSAQEQRMHLGGRLAGLRGGSGGSSAARRLRCPRALPRRVHRRPCVQRCKSCES